MRCGACLAGAGVAAVPLDLRNDFPPCVHRSAVVRSIFRRSLTSFVGRRRRLPTCADSGGAPTGHADWRGGAGKTRLAVQVAAEMAGDLGADAWFVDLAPVTDPDNVAAAMAGHSAFPISRAAPRWTHSPVSSAASSSGGAGQL